MLPKDKKEREAFIRGYFSGCVWTIFSSSIIGGLVYLITH